MDEDAEADTAIRAALVRQTSNAAMQAFRRLTELEMAGDALAFGRITHDDDETLYIGRLSVLDGDEALLVDWRAGAASAFYQATPIDRMGVRHRRHLMYGDGVTTLNTQLIGYSDEVFDLDQVTEADQLRGEAAILATIEAPTEQQMKSVVATIQAEQDRIIRAPSTGALVVQGGPGTGKTVVALHRAAYLLYNQRAALAENGVLIVGPTNEFLTYIAGVLPSLGETGVVSVTATGLFGDILLGLDEPEELASLKGEARMATLLEKAVSDRQRQPTRDLIAWYGSDRVKVTVDELMPHFETARRYRTHNDGAEAFRTSIIEMFVAKVYDEAFSNYEDAWRTFQASREIKLFLLRHWPTLTPEQALNDLFGSRALLRLAATATDHTAQEIASFERARVDEASLANTRWSEADVPLLDELLALVGIVGENRSGDRIRERDERTEFELAADAEDEFFDEDDEFEPAEVAARSRENDETARLGDLGYATVDEEDFAPISPLPNEGWLGGEQLG